MNTFPSWDSLSSAPKHKALELIEKYEKVNRNFYGGAIGFFIDFDGNFNHAIIIRSFFSKNNILSYQAGAGIVIDSKTEKELEEVQNKLRALDQALIDGIDKMKRIFLIDNYDSFAYNLLFYLKELGCDVTVKRNDLFEIDDIKDFDAILISPGPGIPSESENIGGIKNTIPKVNILGVCLGQQAIAEAFGGKLRNLEKVYHGVATKINVVEEDLILKE